MRISKNAKRFVAALITMVVIGMAWQWSAKPKPSGEKCRQALQKIV